MSELNRVRKRVQNWSLGKGFMTSTERHAKEAADRQTVLDKKYAGAQMPDEELIQRNERRKAAGRRGSRQRNVLTADEDMLG